MTRRAVRYARDRSALRVSPKAQGAAVGALLCTAVLAASATALALPDGRAYERVTPANKNGGDVGGPADRGLLASAYGQSATSGEAIAYVSLSSFANAVSAPLVTQYVSTRAAGGWITQAVSPPVAVTSTVQLRLSPFQVFTSELTAAILDWRQPALTGDAPQGVENLYTWRGGRSFQLVTTAAPPASEAERYAVSYAGASSDLTHVVFEADAALVPGAPGGVRSVYEAVGSTVRLVSVLPGAAGPEMHGAGAGDGANDNYTDAVSSNGSRVFWTSSAGQLYVRENGMRTIQLNASRRAGAAADGTARLLASTQEGSVAVFADETPLTEGAEDHGGLYVYNLEDEQLRDLTPTSGEAVGVRGILGMSADGSRIYFAASAALAPGATAGADNLYLADGGSVEFIATLTPSDGTDWTQRFAERTARVTPGGGHLAFLSHASLTGYDNRDVATGEPVTELYVYDAAEGRIRCASCDPSGARPLGPASIPPGPSASYEPRIMSENGSEVFFDSPDPLVSQASNGQQNVFEYEHGKVYLMSSGASAGPTALVDTSANGANVFFTTSAELVVGDEGEGSNIYDARVGGGFAVSSTPLPCIREGCRGPLSASPDFAAPASMLTTGEGNPPAGGALREAKKAGSKPHKRRRHRRRRRLRERKGRARRGHRRHRRHCSPSGRKGQRARRHRSCGDGRRRRQGRAKARRQRAPRHAGGAKGGGRQ